MKKNIVIFDLDGVLVNNDHRYYHSPITCNCGLEFAPSSHQDSLNIITYGYYKFFRQRGFLIYIFTARSEECKFETIKWLKEHDITYDMLEMRSNDDYRPYYAIKQDFILKNFPSNAMDNIKAIFDQDEGTLEMYKHFKIIKIFNCK